MYLKFLLPNILFFFFIYELSNLYKFHFTFSFTFLLFYGGKY